MQRLAPLVDNGGVSSHRGYYDGIGGGGGAGGGYVQRPAPLHERRPRHRLHVAPTCTAAGAEAVVVAAMAADAAVHGERWAL